MKVTFLGTGTMGSITRGNQSILVDDVLFDIGSGVVKKLEALQLYTKHIRYLVITHVHADHFVDLPNFLIGRSIRKENNEQLKIICGKGIKSKVLELFELCFGNNKKTKYTSKNFEEGFNVEFIELENGEIFKTEDMEITAYELEHGECKPILGFTLKKNGKTIGYATDTTLCENVRKICENSEYALIDATNTISTNSHMGLEETVQVAKKYPKCKIYAIHRSDYVHSHVKEVNFPEDGEVLEI